MRVKATTGELDYLIELNFQEKKAHIDSYHLFLARKPSLDM